MGKYGSNCSGGKTGSKRRGVDELGMTMKSATKGRKEDTEGRWKDDLPAWREEWDDDLPGQDLVEVLTEDMRARIYS